MTEFDALIPALIALAAILYAAVGHGGASAYLAILALSGYPVFYIKSSALLLNVVVSFIAFLRFSSKGFFNLRVFLPLAISSVPAAYFAAGWRVEDSTYHVILGLVLLVFGLIMFGFFDKAQGQTRDPHVMMLVCSGMVLGVLSGILGIGGGILLSPLLILAGWSGTKETAGISALFIASNSVAGLLGSYSQATELLHYPHLPIYLACALVGGIIGSWFGAIRFNAIVLKKTLAVVLFTAGLKLIFGES